jgi:hypothetical protein
MKLVQVVEQEVTELQLISFKFRNKITLTGRTFFYSNNSRSRWSRSSSDTRFKWYILQIHHFGTITSTGGGGGRIRSSTSGFVGQAGGSGGGEQEVVVLMKVQEIHHQYHHLKEIMVVLELVPCVSSIPLEVEVEQPQNRRRRCTRWSNWRSRRKGAPNSISGCAVKDILAEEVVEQMQLEQLVLVVLFQRLLQLLVRWRWQ